MKKLPNIHPGTVLSEEFLGPMGITAYRLAKDIGIPQTRVSRILKGERRVTADTALRLSRYSSRRRRLCEGASATPPASGWAFRTTSILRRNWR